MYTAQTLSNFKMASSHESELYTQERENHLDVVETNQAKARTKSRHSIDDNIAIRAHSSIRFTVPVLGPGQALQP